MRNRVKDRARLRARQQQTAPLSVERQFKAAMRVWKRHVEGFVCLAARNASTDHWVERCFDVINERGAIKRFLKDHPSRVWHLYYCPNAFAEPKRLAIHALPTPFAWCDIDGGDPYKFDPRPTILVETSPGRYQGIWELDRAIEPKEAEALSKGLTYRFGGDPNGWSITKLLRVPETVNHKPEYDMPGVSIEEDSGKPIRVWTEREYTTTVPAIIDADPHRHDWQEVVRRFRPKLSGNMYRLMTDTWCISHDRSRCVFMIISALHEAGALPNEIAAVVWRSPYFISKYGQRRDRLNAELGRILAKIGGAP